MYFVTMTATWFFVYVALIFVAWWAFVLWIASLALWDAGASNKRAARRERAVLRRSIRKLKVRLELQQPMTVLVYRPKWEGMHERWASRDHRQWQEEFDDLLRKAG